MYSDSCRARFSPCQNRLVPSLQLVWIATLSFALAQPSVQVITHGPRDQPKIALTFDADMTYGMKQMLRSGRVRSYNNARIYQILNRTKTKATFFLSGMWIELYPDETKHLAQNPLFELENHGYSHPSFETPCFGLPKLTDSKASEVLKTRVLLKKVAGVTNRYFRFPGGCQNAGDVALVAKLGLEAVLWDVVGGDGNQPNKEVIVGNILARVQNGSIIVLHSHGGPKVPKTADALEEIIPALKARGFQFVKLSELLGQ